MKMRRQTKNKNKTTGCPPKTRLFRRVDREHVLHGVVLPDLGQLRGILELLRQNAGQEIQRPDDDVEQEDGHLEDLGFLAHGLEELRCDWVIKT